MHIYVYRENVEVQTIGSLNSIKMRMSKVHGIFEIHFQCPLQKTISTEIYL